MVAIVLTNQLMVDNGLLVRQQDIRGLAVAPLTREDRIEWPRILAFAHVPRDTTSPYTAYH